jgi:aryl-phospho-beta-D-glucosidase BglC (GH1 family)
LCSSHGLRLHYLTILVNESSLVAMIRLLITSYVDDSAIVDEWTYGEFQDHCTALEILQNHWDTFITEQDFIQIAAAGLNHVRIPIVRMHTLANETQRFKYGFLSGILGIRYLWWRTIHHWPGMNASPMHHYLRISYALSNSMIT